MFYFKDNQEDNAVYAVTDRQCFTFNVQYVDADNVAHKYVDMSQITRACYGALTSEIRTSPNTVRGYVKTNFNIFDTPADLVAYYKKYRSDVGIYIQREIFENRFQKVIGCLHQYVPHWNGDYALHISDNDHTLFYDDYLLPETFLPLNAYWRFNINDLYAYEIFFILDIIRKLYTAVCFKTTNIIFHLLGNNDTWNGFDVVSLLYYADHFNYHAPGDSTIGWNVLNNLHMLQRQLTPESFQEIRNRISGYRGFSNYWQLIMQHAVDNEQWRSFYCEDDQDMIPRGYCQHNAYALSNTYDTTDLEPRSDFSEEYLNPFISHMMCIKRYLENNSNN